MYKEGDFILNAKDGRQYRTFDLSLEGEKIEGYAVVFEQPTLISEDPYTGTEFFEMISRNAFEGCDMSDVVLNVDHEGTPIARTRAGTLTLFIDQHGLKIEASLKTARGREVWEDVKAGNLDKMSFAFNVKEESYDSSTRTRTIEKIEKLWDVSIVTHPAYEQTCVYARNSMANRVQEEQRAYVKAKLESMKGFNFPKIPEMRDGVEWAGLEYDIEALGELREKAQQLTQWEPKGIPEDVPTVNQKAEDLNSIIAQIEDLNKETCDKISAVENRTGGQFYGWSGAQVAPNTEEQIKAFAHRGLPLRFYDDLPEEWLVLYDSINPTYNYSKKRKVSIPNLSDLERRSTIMENIESRALQSYLCKGIPQMTEDERRALSTTGSGSAVIPTSIANRIISNAGYSILTHRATHLNDGRLGRIVVPVAPAAAGVGWHSELSDISIHDQTLSSLSMSGAELVKLVAASRAMMDMATENFENYLVNLLSGEMLDALEQSYVTGKAGTDNCPGDGLDNLTLTGRVITATDSITIENIAAAVAKLPAKVQPGALIMGNASTLASVLTAKGDYAFDVRSTLKDMGLELVQNPHVSDDCLYIVGEPSQSLFLNFWQGINVRRSDDALLTKNAVAFLASTVAGFAWYPDYVTKVEVSA